MKFTKGNIIIRSEQPYPNGALVVDGYDADGTLLAHPVGGGFQCRLKLEIEKAFRIVQPTEIDEALWKSSRFTIESSDTVFQGWTSGKDWNGWATPHFELFEAKRVIEALTDFNGKYDVERDCFITATQDSEAEIWEGQIITLVGGSQIKVYGIGAGSWIWEEA